MSRLAASGCCAAAGCSRPAQLRYEASVEDAPPPAAHAVHERATREADARPRPSARRSACRKSMDVASEAERRRARSRGCATERWPTPPAQISAGACPARSTTASAPSSSRSPRSCKRRDQRSRERGPGELVASEIATRLRRHRRHLRRLPRALPHARMAMTPTDAAEPAPSAALQGVGLPLGPAAARALPGALLPDAYLGRGPARSVAFGAGRARHGRDRGLDGDLVAHRGDPDLRHRAAAARAASRCSARRSMRDAAAPYAHELIFLFMGGFLLALAMQRWGLHRRIALRDAAPGRRPARARSWAASWW